MIGWTQLGGIWIYAPHANRGGICEAGDRGFGLTTLHPTGKFRGGVEGLRRRRRYFASFGTAQAALLQHIKRHE